MEDEEKTDETDEDDGLEEARSKRMEDEIKVSNLLKFMYMRTSSLIVEQFHMVISISVSEGQLRRDQTAARAEEGKVGRDRTGTGTEEK